MIFQFMASILSVFAFLIYTINNFPNKKKEETDFMSKQQKFNKNVK